MIDFIDLTIPVVEIFQSVSGEGVSAGYITTFVRVAGCNLRCTYCDSTYSYAESGNTVKIMKPNEILRVVTKFDCKYIICTGGEPLEPGKSKRMLPLYLASKGFKIRIETNGSCPVYSRDEILPYLKDGSRLGSVNYTLDIKCPGSGMVNHNIFDENLANLIHGDELKFVVGNKEDIQFACDILKKYSTMLNQNNIVINISPSFQGIEPAALVDLLKEKHTFFAKEELKVRLSLQIHKYIWPPNARGV